MQRRSIRLSRGKAALLFVIVAAGISLAIPACKKDDNGTITENSGLTQADMNDVLTQSITDPNSGVVTQINASVSTTNDYVGRKAANGKDGLPELCNVSHSAGVPVSIKLDTISLDAAVYYNWMLNCADGVPQNFEFDYKGHVNVSIPRFEAKDSIVATIKIGGLDSDAANFVVNDAYASIASITSKVKDQKSYSSNVQFTTTDVKVSKETGAIISGSATIKMTGAIANGSTYAYDGTIVFLGNGKATFTSSKNIKIDLNWNK